VELSAVRFALAAVVAGWLGDSAYRVGSGEAEYDGPALEAWLEPVALADGLVGGGVGQD